MGYLLLIVVKSQRAKVKNQALNQSFTNHDTRCGIRDTRFLLHRERKFIYCYGVTPYRTTKNIVKKRTSAMMEYWSVGMLCLKYFRLRILDFEDSRLSFRGGLIGPTRDFF